MYSVEVLCNEPLESIIDVSACFKTNLGSLRDISGNWAGYMLCHLWLPVQAKLFIAHVGIHGVTLLFIFVIFSFIVL